MNISTFVVFFRPHVCSCILFLVSAEGKCVDLLGEREGVYISRTVGHSSSAVEICSGSSGVCHHDRSNSRRNS
jgi:hypothetical protein